ncbi:MAG TPA: C40 family peptidase [Pseudonocardia sp.]|nr:C40 family peptidase [Pseudonocardia sp.]
MLALTVGFLLIVTTVLIGGVVGGGGCAGDGGPGGGARQIGPRSWSGEQTANAQLITSVVAGRGLPRRAAVIAVTTAIVESQLRNLGHGDRDSLGLFQQRPSQGWGPPERVLNPTLATGAFLDRLVAIPGWATMAPGMAEQLVQRSAFPDAYGPQEPAAADLVGAFWTGPDNPLPLAPAAPGTAQLASFALPGCGDQGGSDVPLGPADLNVKAMPPGYQLPADPAARAAVAFAIAQLGKPYVWGATGPNAYDCSGLMQAAWANARVGISRSTATQVHDGTPVAVLGQLAAGDLLFIPGASGTPARPGHVGIYAGDGLVIDAYDSSRGVIVERLAAWAPKIVSVRRVSPTPNPSPPAPMVLAEGSHTP